jgi:hypothetical protein
VTRLQDRRVDTMHHQWWSLRRWHGHAHIYKGEDYAGLVCAGPYLTRRAAARALDRIAERRGAS